MQLPPPVLSTFSLMACPLLGCYNHIVLALPHNEVMHFWKHLMHKSNKQTRKPRALRSRTFLVFFQREANGVYTAHIPALQIVTEGETLEKAKEMATDAIEGWIEAARELGKPIPDDLPIARVEVTL